MNHPYQNLPAEAFWKTAVAQPSSFDIEGLWRPKYRFDKLPIYTAGSCFAQHFGKALAGAGLNWHLAEAPPAGVSESLARRYNYGVFSARTGNIYTTPMLLQWLEYAFGKRRQLDEVWEKDGRFYDPLRPAIEPKGFVSPEELMTSRQMTLNAMRETLTSGCIFVFTLGLTESWVNRESGTHYAMCPGTAAGQFDPNKHEFLNLGHAQVRRALERSIEIIRGANPKNRILLTVSPVPLTATASNEHVLTATTYSKSVLRAVAGETASARGKVDYFPSYEIITGIPFRSMWFDPNLRSVRPEGVQFVMKSFFEAHGKAFGPLATKERKERSGKSQAVSNSDDLVCEEAMLAAFGG